jgi:hypothetical protein
MAGGRRNSGATERGAARSIAGALNCATIAAMMPVVAAAGSVTVAPQHPEPMQVQSDSR